MLMEQQISDFDRNGFVNGGKILDDAELEQLTSALGEMINRGPGGYSGADEGPVSFKNISGNDERPVWQIVNVWEASEAFQKLIYHSDIVQGISQLTREADLMVWHDQVQYKPAQYGGATTWHQDAPLWPIIRPMTPVSAWIPFDDADEKNGCMWMVPGSHKWGNQIEFLREQGELRTLDEFNKLKKFNTPEESETNSVEPVAWPVKRGEVSFHHSLTWHGSPLNQSIRPRRAIAIHYMTGQARYDANGEHIMKQFVDLPNGAPMADAGKHFPLVCHNGIPVSL
ncbi:MAG: phytanoyl-CoA dioxygenase family protein [Candidatus Latescibacterota bacterium]|nr:phytanoyl-CoA dioxygenase family protein [Candidatus Latescibacterota bacterium]